MEYIKVGEYVRTKQGIIRKADEVFNGNYINTDEAYFDYELDGYNRAITPDEIKKHSFNIIDLIEVGDYVNGYKVKDIQLWNIFFNGKHEYKLDFGELGTMKSGEIITVVTKEQFESMKYVVGDN